MKTKFLYLIPLLFFSIITSAHANLIVNGNFEEPVNVTNGTWRIFRTIPGWYSPSGAGIEVQRNVAGKSFDGLQHVELDSTSNSSMVQSVATIPGVPYLLSFAYSPRPGVPLASNVIHVLVNGVLRGSFQLNGLGLTNTRWSTHSIAVTPTTNNTTIEFRAVLTSDGQGGYIDDVIFAPLR